MSVRTDLDELIDWYERNTTAGVRTLQVCATANTVRKFARKARRGPFTYRGQVIVPIRKSRNDRALPPEQTEATV
jgi:hypothetical protein